jgi:hypothetical protein
VETTASMAAAAMKAAPTPAATAAWSRRCSVINADREKNGKKQGDKSGFEERRHGNLRDIPCGRKHNLTRRNLDSIRREVIGSGMKKPPVSRGKLAASPHSQMGSSFKNWSK